MIVWRTQPQLEQSEHISHTATPEQEAYLEDTQHQLSLNALKGVNGICTIRFKAKLQG